MSEILDAEKIARLKIPSTIPAHLEFIPTNVGDVESEEEKRARTRAQSLADKSYASKEASHLQGLYKLKQKFNRATSGSETCKCADQLTSPSISQVRPNQDWSRKPNIKASVNTSASIGELTLLSMLR